MTAKQAKLIATDEALRKRLAKFMALQCFRNTGLEDLHAGIGPDSATGDYTDVRVVTPCGEIPWNELSRFNDDEMKASMIEVVNKTYTLLTTLFSPTSKQTEALLALIEHLDLTSHWNEPEFKPMFSAE